MVFTPSSRKLLRNMPGPFSSTYCMATWPLSLACISITKAFVRVEQKVATILEYSSLPENPADGMLGKV